MEPVTHVLTGACLARSGLNRRTAYATVAMAVAAELPDIDTVWSLRGPVEGFQHHRGSTHTLIGIPFEAALLLLIIFLLHRFRSRSGEAQPPVRDAGTPAWQHGTRHFAAPLRWDLLYAFILLALASHLLLDFTNNYGIRPFFPFGRRWYAGSFVFIFDPLLFLLLVAGLTLPSLFALVGREIGAPRESFRGRGWARAALVGVVCLWSVRWFEHDKAVATAQTQTLRAPAEQSELSPFSGTSNLPGLPPNTPAQSSGSEDRALLLPQRSLASPDPLSIFRWYTATDFGPAYRLALVDSRMGTLAAGDILVKPSASPTLEAAERSKLGRVYLDWSPMPLLRIQEGMPANAPGAEGTQSGAKTVTFTDLRFLGDLPFLQGDGRAPLTAKVVMNPSQQVVAEGLDGRFEH